MILLQINEIPEKALEISPYNSLAFGFLVIVLSSAVVYLWKALRSEQKYGREISDKVIELVTKVSIGYEADKELKDEIRREWPAIREEFKRLRETIEKKLNH